MKKLSVLIFTIFFVCINSCSTLNYVLGEGDATSAIKEMLSFGTAYGADLLSKKNALSKENLLASILPGDVGKILNTLETLGLSKEVNRFSATLSTVAEKSAEKSVPIFLQGIKNMGIKNAVKIVKNGGTSATDYLRTTIGDTLRRALQPGINAALDEYKLATQFNDMVAPAKMFVGNKLNLDLSSLISGLVANLMFNKIAEKEQAIRNKAAERKTVLLQKVFGQITHGR